MRRVLLLLWVAAFIGAGFLVAAPGTECSGAIPGLKAVPATVGVSFSTPSSGQLQWLAASLPAAMRFQIGNSVEPRKGPCSTDAEKAKCSAFDAKKSPTCSAVNDKDGGLCSAHGAKQACSSIKGNACSAAGLGSQCSATNMGFCSAEGADSVCSAVKDGDCSSSKGAFCSVRKGKGARCTTLGKGTGKCSADDLESRCSVQGALTGGNTCQGLH